MRICGNGSFKTRLLRLVFTESLNTISGDSKERSELIDFCIIRILNGRAGWQLPLINFINSQGEFNLYRKRWQYFKHDHFNFYKRKLKHFSFYEEVFRFVMIVKAFKMKFQADFRDRIGMSIDKHFEGAKRW